MFIAPREHLTKIDVSEAQELGSMLLGYQPIFLQKGILMKPSRKPLGNQVVLQQLQIILYAVMFMLIKHKDVVRIGDTKIE